MKAVQACLVVSLLASWAGAQLPEPKACDLDVLYIQRTPRQPGYLPNYGVPGHAGEPWIAKPGADGQPAILDLAEVNAQPHWPPAGERVTYTAVIENKGTQDAPPFEYAWYLDGRAASAGKTEAALPPGQRVELAFEWPWAFERHEIKLWVDPMRRVRQYSFDNDERAVWTHAKRLYCGVDRATYECFARQRNQFGTYSFEDWCQQHADWMNHLFAQSIYPDTAPDGILERVAVDCIAVYDSEEAYSKHWEHGCALADGWDGAWFFGRNEKCAEWAAFMDWGLIHEWGHQFGLTDIYALDVPTEHNLVLDAQGAPLLIGRHAFYRGTMMHGHGPVLFSEDQAIALNHQLWRRRGFYGDYYYNLAPKSHVQINDAAGRPVADARLRFWQRDTDSGVFDGQPIFSGATGADGRFLLPNRPTPHVVTPGDRDGGYEQRDNPFGLINVVGANGVMFVEVVARSQTDYVFFDVTQLNVAQAREPGDSATLVLPTTLPTAKAAAAPAAPEVVINGNDVTATLAGATRWTLLRADPITYEWQTVGTADGPTLTDKLPHSGLFRYAAATEQDGVRSARSAPVGVAALGDPWGLTVAPDGLIYVRDRANGQTLILRGDGSAVGFVGSVHWHLEGSCDHAADAQGRLCVAKWPDGYDPKRAWIRRIDPHGRGREHDRQDLAGGEFDSIVAGRFREPMGIWVSPEDGTIVVADTGNNRVQVLGPDGQVDEKNVVTGLNKPNKALLAGGRLVVCDTGAKRVALFERQGDAWRPAGEIAGFEEPVYCCRASGDSVWVADRGLGRVLAINAKTGRKTDWQFPPANESKLADLRGIAFAAGELLYVDGQNKRVVRVPGQK